MAKSAGGSMSYYVKIIIGILIVWCFGFIPAPEPMTSLGMRMIGIFAGTIYLFSVGGLIWPSLMAIVAMAYSGAFTSFSAVIQNSLGQATVWQIICLMPLCEGISRSGAMNVVSGWLLSRPGLRGKVVRISIVIMLTAFIEGILASTVAAILLTFALLGTLREMLGFEKGEGWILSMTVGGFLAAFLGGSTIPFRGLVAAMVIPIGQISGTPLNNAAYIAATVVLGVIFCILMGLCMKYVLRVDMSKLEKFDPESMTGDKHFNKQQIILLLAFAIIMVFFIIQIFLPRGTDLYTAYSNFVPNGLFPIVIGILAILHIDGKPALDLRAMFKEGVPWGILLSVAAMLCVASQFTSDEAGIVAWLNEVLGGIISGMHPAVFVLVVLFLTIVITGCMSNYATCVIILTLALPFCEVVGVGVIPMGIAIVFCSCCAALTPGGGAPCPLLFSNENVPSYAGLYKHLIPQLVIFWLLMSASVLVMGMFI